MAPLGFDLNQEAPPDWDNPIDWEAIGEWEGPEHALGYNFVWDDGNNGAASFQRFSLWKRLTRHFASTLWIGPIGFS